MALHWTIPSGIFQVCQVCRQDIQDKVLESNEDLPLEGKGCLQKQARKAHSSAFCIDLHRQTLMAMMDNDHNDGQ